MRKMTDTNLSQAFAGESQAHMRYLIFADQAEKEGHLNLARLYRAIAFAERVHATNHFRALGQAGTTLDNLGVAIAGETFEVEEMYPAYREVAKLQEEKKAERSISYALEAEKVHAVLYGEAKQTLANGGGDVLLGDIQICDVCGHTVVGQAPDKCPLCGAPRQHYRKF
ncbi:MAG: rubrerythrin family protein [Chloroflexi bacterium]|nr:rubrerythrin family protein [Chloroflexota bacterium]